MPSKFSLFAKRTKELESKAQGLSDDTFQKTDAISAKDKNPDDLEIK